MPPSDLPENRCEACSGGGYFVVPDVPGVLTHAYPRRRFVPKWTERCDTCERYPDDAAAIAAMHAAGYIPKRLSAPAPRQPRRH